MGKNIILCFDGTCNDPKDSVQKVQLSGSIEDHSISNALKLHLLLGGDLKKKKEFGGQVSFYYSGVGTYGSLAKQLRNQIRAPENENVGTIIKMGMKDLYQSYETGDQLFVFGFSRGATTVRSLSAFIHLFGILPKSRPELIKRAYSIYSINNAEKRKRKADEFLKLNHTMWTKIKFIGVWDTVAALGLPFKFLDVIIDQIPFFHHSYHNLDLSESVVHARHALAIDDERLTFHPKIWNKEIKEYQTMKQVWFLGMHTDVGGGYKEQQLSDIPLIWMLNEAVEKGLRIYPKYKVSINPDANGFMHNSRGGFFTQFYRKKIRTWDYKTKGNLVLHQSVLMRKKNKNNTDDPVYNSWVLAKEYVTEPWPENLRKKFSELFRNQP